MIDAFARQMLYPAPPVPVPSPPPAPLAEVGLELATGDRAVGWAWEDPGLPEKAPLVLFFHGNGENLETLRWSGFYDEMRRLGVPFLAVDFPGYGRSSGEPSEEGLLAAGDAAVAWARELHPARPAVLCGWSLGAAVAVAAADRNAGKVAGLIALSAWTTLAEVAVGIFPAVAVQAMLRETYDSRAAARRIRIPSLVVHGELDDLIPVEQGQEIAAALGDSARWVPVPRTGHNDLLGRPIVWQEIGAFLAAL